MRQKPEFHYDKIVVGSGLSALLFAYYHDYPVVFSSSKPPFFGDTITVDNPVEFGYKEEQINQFKLWSLLHIVLGIKGLLVSAGIAESVRFEQNFLKVQTTNSSMKVHYNELIVFEPSHLNSFEYVQELVEDRQEVLDWFNIKEGARWEIDKIELNQKHINQIWFYNSERTTKTYLKDCVARSILTQEELKDDMVSEGLTRLRVQNILRENGTDPYTTVEFDGRDIIDKSVYSYKEKEHIVFMQDTPQEIWDKYHHLESESSRTCQKLLTSPELSP